MPDNFTFKDANNISRTIRATETPGGQYIPHNIVSDMPFASTDSFSRFRVSPPAFRFDSQLTYGIDSDLWDSSVTGGSVTHDSTNRLAVLTANAAGTNTAVLQAHYHAPYTPGRSQLSFVTFKFGTAPGTGAYRRAGYYDGSNGVYLQQTETAVSLVCASGTTHGITSVDQADWNVDKFDGTGPSGLTLDLSKTQILVVSLQALYVGRAYAGFDINGKVWPAHTFDHANEADYPYIQTANLPVRYEVGTTNAAVSMSAVCASVISEGGERLEDIPARTFPVWGEFTNTASKLLFAIRVKQQLNGIINHTLVIPTHLDVVIGDAPAWITVLLNPTFSAGTWESVDAASSVEKTFAGNAGTDPTVSSNGRVIDRFYVPASATARISKTAGLTGKLALCYSHLLNAGDSIAVLVEGSGTTGAWGSMVWKEIR